MGLTDEEYNTYFAMKQEFTDLNNRYHEEKTKIEETYEKDSEEYDTANDELYWEKKNIIIDSIMNSNFTNEQKAYVYNKYYDSDKNDIIVTAGIDVNYLLDYEKNDFKANYKADGKAIPNSRKTKLLAMLTTMIYLLQKKQYLLSRQILSNSMSTTTRL